MGVGDSVSMLELHASQIQFDGWYTIRFLRTIITTMHIGFFRHNLSAISHNNYDIYFQKYHGKVQSQVKHEAALYITRIWSLTLYVKKRVMCGLNWVTNLWNSTATIHIRAGLMKLHLTEPVLWNKVDTRTLTTKIPSKATFTQVKMNELCQGRSQTQTNFLLLVETCHPWKVETNCTQD